MADSADSPADPARWCDCTDAPIVAPGAATFFDHPDGCAFPDGVCSVRAHRVTVHARCGRELLMRYCGCGATAFTHDLERDWWVHYVCGWPTRAWFDAAGRPAPDHLAGMRPVTYHEFVAVPESPRTTYERLGEAQRIANKARAGGWVRD